MPIISPWYCKPVSPATLRLLGRTVNFLDLPEMQPSLNVKVHDADE